MCLVSYGDTGLSAVLRLSVFGILCMLLFFGLGFSVH